MKKEKGKEFKLKPLAIVNKFGNVYLTKTPLNSRYVHVRGKRLTLTCKKLKIRHAPAIVGFKNSGFGSSPIFDGVVISARKAEALAKAIQLRDEVARRRKAKELQKKRAEREEFEKLEQERWDSILVGAIELPVLSIAELEDAAGRYPEEQRRIREGRRNMWEQYCIEREWEIPYDDDQSYSPPGGNFKHRISVNHLRHECTDYNRVIEREGETSEFARDYISRVFKAIAKAYPHLKAECDRQLKERNLT